MITGAAVVPSAPLLAPGVSATLPTCVQPVADAVSRTLAALPPHDVAIVLAAGAASAVHIPAMASLAGIGRPDLCVALPVEAELGASLAYPVTREPLPLDLAVLTRLLAEHDAGPVVPLAVGPGEGAAHLAAGQHLAETLAGAPAVVLLAAGDLSAGLGPHAPLHLVAGAARWDELAVAAIALGQPADLSELGPAEACRVGARAWGPLVLLAAASAAAGAQLEVDVYAAPRGVGYLVAHGPPAPPGA